VAIERKETFEVAENLEGLFACSSVQKSGAGSVDPDGLLCYNHEEIFRVEPLR